MRLNLLALLSLSSFAFTHSIPTTSSNSRLAKRAPGSVPPNYPAEDVPGPTPLPAWVEAYNTAKAAGLIPKIPQSTQNAAGEISYNGFVGACSWTDTGCFSDSDLHNSPSGNVGIAFDDVRSLLYRFENRKLSIYFPFMLSLISINNTNKHLN